MSACERVVLDHYVEPEGAGEGSRPEWRYCVCGWTEAHHQEGEHE